MHFQRAFAPASVGNVAVGFDLLGHSIAGPGDIATVRRVAEAGVRITAIRGSTRELPMAADQNTAGAGLLLLLRTLQIDSFGFDVELDKGIPFGSGMGGSAASAVAALVAANALLDQPLTREELYPFAMAGESVASGSAHGDNVGPMLVGGLALATRERVVRLPVPAGLACLLVHPHAELETRRAREVLRAPYPLRDFVIQSEHLATFLVACQRGDVDMLRGSIQDVLVEPRRVPLVPGFAAAKRAALDADALGASLSGAGPSLFAWFETRDAASAAAPAVQAGFRSVGLESDVWVSLVDGPRAELLAPEAS